MRENHRNAAYWKTMGILAIFWSLVGAIGFGLITGDWTGVVWGFFLGLVGGPLVYRAQPRPEERVSGRVEDSPRYLVTMLVIIPVFVVTSFAISLIALGNGLYGIPVGVVLASAASFLVRRRLA